MPERKRFFSIDVFPNPFKHLEAKETKNRNDLNQKSKYLEKEREKDKDV